MTSTYSYEGKEQVRDRKGGRPIQPVQVTPEIKEALAYVQQAWDGLPGSKPDDYIRFEFKLGPPQLAPLLSALRRDKHAEETVSYFRPDGTLYRIRFTCDPVRWADVYVAWDTVKSKLPKGDQ